jgi:hypothetical protein
VTEENEAVRTELRETVERLRGCWPERPSQRDVSEKEQENQQVKNSRKKVRFGVDKP